MTKRRSFLLTATLFISLAGSLYYNSTRSGKEPCTPPVSISNVEFEVEPSFLIWDRQIFFSANSGGNFSLYKYEDGKTVLHDTLTNIMYPFLFKGEVTGLQDHEGDEKFKAASPVLNHYSDGNIFETVFSFKNGFLLVFRLKGDNNVYILDAHQKIKKVLLNDIKNLHSIRYSEEYNVIIANYDNMLISINLNNNNQKAILASNEEGGKMNPFIYGNEIYFANNSNSEYYNIYNISLKDSIKRPQLIHQSAHDLRMPKRRGTDLFYIEIINSEYILKYIDLKSLVVNTITKNGVVYNYEFYNSKVLALTYSDFNTPKSVLLYNTGTRTFNNITGSTLNPDISYQFVQKTVERSPAYLFTPGIRQKINGVILFFHPGLHSDFSPRWDALISNLCNNGYILIAPNYPMSSGFGRSHYNAGFSLALSDIKNWKEYIFDTYDGLPLYYLSASSGNVLMEQSLANDSRGVTAAASLFGVPSIDPPDPAVPTVYLLGINDPLIHYPTRSSRLLKAQNDEDIVVISYADEGHWFRKPANLRDAIQQIINRFCGYAG